MPAAPALAWITALMATAVALSARTAQSRTPARQSVNVAGTANSPRRRRPHNRRRS